MTEERGSSDRWRDLGPHRSPAGHAHDLDHAGAARLWHVFRALRSAFHRLCRAEPRQVRRADGQDGRSLRHDRRRELHRGAVCRPLRRHDPVRLSRRRLWPPGDLHLVASLVLGRQYHGGDAKRRLRPQPLAVRQRRRARPRDGDDRRLCERACAQGAARPRLRGQPGDRLFLRAGDLVPRLRARARGAARNSGMALGGADRRAGCANRRGRSARPARKSALARQAWPPRRSRSRS